MTAMLNIDEVSNKGSKTLVFKGVKHEAAVLTLQEYIDRLKRTKNLDKEAPVSEQIEETVTMLSEMFPTVDAADWRAMPLFKLNAVIEFALAPPEEIAAKVESAASENQGNE